MISGILLSSQIGAVVAAKALVENLWRFDADVGLGIIGIPTLSASSTITLNNSIIKT